MSFLTGQPECGRQPFLCTPISACPAMASKLVGDCQRDNFLHSRPRTPPTHRVFHQHGSDTPTDQPLTTTTVGRQHITNVYQAEESIREGQIFKRDMAILSIAYTLQESTKLQRLMQLIVVIRNKDSEGQLTFAMYHAYRSLTVLSSSLPKF